MSTDHVGDEVRVGHEQESDSSTVTETRNQFDGAGDSFDPSAHYELSPNVSLRPESFGALAYHFGNRRLSFLKSPELVALVEGLHEHHDVRETLAANGIPESRHGSYIRALAALAASDMIVRT